MCCKNSERFSVWVGGIEVNDRLLSKRDAEFLASEFRRDGYDDVQIDKY